MKGCAVEDDARTKTLPYLLQEDYGCPGRIQVLHPSDFMFPEREENSPPIKNLLSLPTAVGISYGTYVHTLAG